jgi:hypothetical protein
MLDFFGRAKTHYRSAGNCVGSMSETHGAWTRDGTDSHTVEQFTLDLWVDKASESYGFCVEG